MNADACGARARSTRHRRVAAPLLIPRGASAPAHIYRVRSSRQTGGTSGNAKGTLSTGVEGSLAGALTDGLGALDIQIHHHRILPASDHDGFTGDVRTGIDFLVRDVGRHVNEVASVRPPRRTPTARPSACARGRGRCKAPSPARHDGGDPFWRRAERPRCRPTAYWPRYARE